MGSDASKLNYRNVVVQLTTKTQPVDADDNEFWNQFWSNSLISVQDIFVLVPSAEIRALREESPNNLATLCYKAVEQLSQIAEASFPTVKDQHTALNCVRLLTRILPYIFEDPEWRSFFWSTMSSDPATAVDGECVPLAQKLISAICDLLFCPDFTVHSISKTGPQGPEDMHTIDSCEYIWQAGVGFAQNTMHNTTHDSNRTEILKLLLTCFSETMYLDRDEAQYLRNKWVTIFTSPANRHVLPMFTSFINVVCAYDPVGFGLPYNYLLFTDSREPLVEVALQILCIVLETSDPQPPDQLLPLPTSPTSRSLRSSVSHIEPDQELAVSPAVKPLPPQLRSVASRSSATTVVTGATEVGSAETNLFVNYMSRIHRDEDFAFILSGLTRLLNSPLTLTYLPGSVKKVQMHQELLVLFWRMCGTNKKFMYYVLKSSQVLELLVPILYHLNEARADQAQIGLVHVGVFILLLLSGERNFGVRLNKPYKGRGHMDIPLFSGTHADLLIVVFHKLITCGHKRLQPLFDCLLTIVANVSPYLKSLSMVTSNKLLHLLEAFSQPWCLYAAPSNYHLVFLLLEVFNNIVQYQFDGNSNLVYTLIRKRQTFYHLANLPTDAVGIQRALRRSIGEGDTCKSDPEDHGVGFIAHDMAGEKIPASVGRSTGVDNSCSSDASVDTKSRSTLADRQVEGSSRKVAGPSLKASLARTPAVDSMTNEHLENASTAAANHQLRSSNEDTLISHSSPARKSRPPGEAERVEEEASSGVVLSDQLRSVALINRQVQTRSEAASGDDDQASTEEATSDHQQGGSPTARELGTPGRSKGSQGGCRSSSNSITGLSGTLPTALTMSTSTVKPAPSAWSPTEAWVTTWKAKMPLQTIMRLLQVLVPQVEKICLDKGLTDESEIVRFLQNGTLVGLLPVPHPILIRKYQSNTSTSVWFRNYLWGVIYLKNVNPPIWYDTNVLLFEVQRT